MNRRLFCGNLCTSALALTSRRLASAASPLLKETPEPADLDSYAIWSILIPVLRPHAHAYLVPALTSVRRLTIEPAPEKPLTPIERAMKGMYLGVQVPEPAREQFMTAARKFAVEEQVPVMLERNLDLARPYRLMDKADLNDYGRLKPPSCVIDPKHPWHRDKRLEREFSGFSSPCQFSCVSFNSTRSLGLVWAESELGFFAYCFEKDGDGWKRRDWLSSGFSEYC